MIPETKILPFSTSELPDGPWLVFSPHPDDETFGMGGTLLLARQKNIEVTLITVTNGNPDGDNFANKILSDISIETIRKNELSEAAKQLGINALFFLDLMDRSIIISDAVIAKVRKWIKQTAPRSLFFPSVLEPHPDHRATAQLVSQAVSQEDQFKLYSYDITVQSPINLLIDTSSVQAKKDAIMKLYVSQLEHNNYIDVITALDKSRTYTLGSQVEFAEGFFCYDNFSTQPLALQIYQQLAVFWQSQQVTPAPLVSVIIRTLNRQSLLKEALDCLSLQTYANIEVIVINDGGISVQQTIDAYQKTFYTIVYHHLDKNHGRSYAANKGLESVSGDYILFLDDDDLLEAEHLAVLVDHLQANSQYIAAYTGTRIDTPGGTNYLSQSFNKYLLRSGNFIPIHSIMFHRDALQNVHFDESLEVYEDWDFWLQLSEIADFLHIEGCSSAIYRAFGDSGIGINNSSDMQQSAKLKVIKKWYPVWSADDLLAIFNAVEKQLQTALEVHQKVIKDSTTNIQQLTQQLDLLKEGHSILFAEHKQLKSHNIQLLEELLTLKEGYNEVNNNNKQLRLELQSVYHSRLWRLLRPVRFILTQLRSR